MLYWGLFSTLFMLAFAPHFTHSRQLSLWACFYQRTSQRQDELGPNRLPSQPNTKVLIINSKNRAAFFVGNIRYMNIWSIPIVGAVLCACNCCSVALANWSECKSSWTFFWQFCFGNIHTHTPTSGPSNNVNRSGERNALIESNLKNRSFCSALIDVFIQPVAFGMCVDAGVLHRV